MTLACHNPMLDRWLAFYADRDGIMQCALNALGEPILCESKSLALSVARYRRRRLKTFRS